MRKLHTVLHKGCSIFIPTDDVQKVPFPPHLSHHFLSLVLLMVVILMGVRWYLIDLLSCLIGSVEHLFTYLIVICMSSSLYFGWPCSLKDLSSPTRDWNCGPAVEAWSYNHWTTRELSVWFLLRDCIQVFCLELHFLHLFFYFLIRVPYFFFTIKNYFFYYWIVEVPYILWNESLIRYMVCKYLLLVKSCLFLCCLLSCF